MTTGGRAGRQGEDTNPGATPIIRIGEREVGPQRPVYIVAEMSANHGHDFDRAVDLVRAAREAGADAIKLQTYTPDTMTIACENKHFRIQGTMWDGRTLHDLYEEAYTPWDWQPRLQEIALEEGLDFFSTPFDATAVEFLEELDVPVYKIASFENVDLPLLERVAETGKPVIMSSGMATLRELHEGVETLRRAGTRELALLKCTSAYPAPAEEMNLWTIPHIAMTFGVPAGLSDHSIELSVPAVAVALGACIVEKHFTLSRELPGPDSAFSLEPHEFSDMVRAVRTVEQALGGVRYGVGSEESSSKVFRRSLFVVEDVAEGETLTPTNVRSIRPGSGMHTRYLDQVLGRRAARSIPRGTPLSWDLVGGPGDERGK